MNITYIIGNGFDLNLGFPTDYKHFYRYYTSQPSSTPLIAEFKKNIREYEDKDWKDLEIGLGKYTAKLLNVDDFVAIYVDIQQSISRYMTMVDSFIKKTINSQEMRNKIKAHFVTPWSLFPNALKNNLTTFNYNLSRGNPVIINVISLNYTHTVEYIIPSNDRTFIVNSISGNIANPKHVHREIGENGLWLGVDNAEQIANESFRENSVVKTLLLKPTSIQESGSTIIEECSNIISSSNLICIFGSSLGETDMSWWKMISSGLANPNCRLIYYTRRGETYVTDQLMYIEQNRIREDLMKLFDIKTNQLIPNAQNKLYVQINSDIFRDRDYSSDIEKNYDSIMESEF